MEHKIEKNYRYGNGQAGDRPIMKRGHIILTAGAALLVSGIIVALVWGISYASSLYANNTVVANTSIEPQASISVRKDVNTLDKSVLLNDWFRRAATAIVSK